MLIMGMGEKAYTASLEDYLEAIYLLSQEKEAVRVTELARKLKIRKASVSEALKRLSKRNLIKHERYGAIILTDKGRKVAAEVNRRHQTFYRFLTEILGVDRELAEQDACALEHAVSRQTLEKLIKFIEENLKGRG